MGNTQGNSGGNLPLIGLLPQIVEAVVDTIIGFLVFILFTPIFYGFSQLMNGAEGLDESLYVSVFWDAWHKLLLSTDVNWAVVVLVVVFASFLFGCFLRHPFWLITSIVFRLSRLERLVYRLAFLTLRWQYGGKNWTEKANKAVIRKYILDSRPFSEIGNEDYARFRHELMKSEGDFSSKYWEHEEFLYFLHDRAFSFLVTFLFTYLLYSFIVAFSLRVFWPSYLPFWVVFGLFCFITFSIYRGVLFHGCAFVTINNVLRDDFNKRRIQS